MTKLGIICGREKSMAIAYLYTAVVFVLGNTNTTHVCGLHGEKETSHTRIRNTKYTFIPHIHKVI